MDNSTKRLFEVVIDDLDEVLSQAVDKHERRLNFGMRAGDKHRKLSSTNFSFHTDSEGREYLLYSEGVSKTNQGGLKHRKLTPRSRRAYANAECPERCVVLCWNY